MFPKLQEGGQVKSSNRKDVTLPAFCREKSCKIRITKIKERNLGKLTIFGGITPFRSRSLAYFLLRVKLCFIQGRNK